MAFKGEDIEIQCSHSIQMPNIHTSLYFDSGEEIVNTSETTSGTQRLITATLTDVLNSSTVYCNVSGGTQASENVTITTIPQEMSP